MIITRFIGILFIRRHVLTYVSDFSGTENSLTVTARLMSEEDFRHGRYVSAFGLQFLLRFRYERDKNFDDQCFQGASKAQQR